jgi:hypothetical protein
MIFTSLLKFQLFLTGLIKLKILTISISGRISLSQLKYLDMLKKHGVTLFLLKVSKKVKIKNTIEINRKGV